MTGCDPALRAFVQSAVVPRVHTVSLEDLEALRGDAWAGLKVDGEHGVLVVCASTERPPKPFAAYAPQPLRRAADVAVLCGDAARCSLSEDATLLEVERVGDTLYLLDVLFRRGLSQLERPFQDRRRVVRDGLGAEFNRCMRAAGRAEQLADKTFVRAGGAVQRLWQRYKEQDAHCDGLVFVPDRFCAPDAPVAFKLKERRRLTVDVQLADAGAGAPGAGPRDDPLYDLLGSARGGDVCPWRCAQVVRGLPSEVALEAAALERPRSRVVEIAPEPDGAWRFVRDRGDKPKPNAIAVTLDPNFAAIQDLARITADEMVEFFGSDATLERLRRDAYQRALGLRLVHAADTAPAAPAPARAETDPETALLRACSDRRAFVRSPAPAAAAAQAWPPADGGPPLRLVLCCGGDLRLHVALGSHRAALPFGTETLAATLSDGGGAVPWRPVACTPEGRLEVCAMPADADDEAPARSGISESGLATRLEHRREALRRAAAAVQENAPGARAQLQRELHAAHGTGDGQDRGGAVRAYVVCAATLLRLSGSGTAYFVDVHPADAAPPAVADTDGDIVDVRPRDCLPAPAEERARALYTHLRFFGYAPLDVPDRVAPDPGVALTYEDMALLFDEVARASVLALYRVSWSDWERLRDNMRLADAAVYIAGRSSHEPDPCLAVAEDRPPWRCERVVARPLAQFDVHTPPLASVPDRVTLRGAWAPAVPRIRQGEGIRAAARASAEAARQRQRQRRFPAARLELPAASEASEDEASDSFVEDDMRDDAGGDADSEAEAEAARTAVRELFATGGEDVDAIARARAREVDEGTARREGARQDAAAEIRAFRALLGLTAEQLSGAFERARPWEGCDLPRPAAALFEDQAIEEEEEDGALAAPEKELDESTRAVLRFADNFDTLEAAQKRAHELLQDESAARRVFAAAEREALRPADALARDSEAAARLTPERLALFAPRRKRPRPQP